MPFLKFETQSQRWLLLLKKQTAGRGEGSTSENGRQADSRSREGLRVPIAGQSEDSDTQLQPRETRP